MKTFNFAGVPIVNEMINTTLESCNELRKEISNVRLGSLGEIHFEFKGKTYSAPEPKDVIVATDINGTNNENSRSWALKQILSGKATL